MRRPLTAVLSLLLALGFSLIALDTATAAPAPASALAKPKESTKVVTAPIDIYKAAAAQTPGGRLDYCAVTVFVVFPEISGYEATGLDYVYTTVSTGATSAESESMQAPYDDVWTWGPLSRNAPAGKHQHMVSGQPSVWQAGSPDCEDSYARTVAAYPDTAVVTYQATEKCAAAVDAYNTADRALTAAKKKLDRAKTSAQRAAAQAQVRSAKAKLAKAKKTWKKRC